ncbi:GRB10-interacting GYF protein 2 [Drosophila albomicans]|uniref:GRB10-interacting GYF protein 2 n=1 Tax=Drosophila albomicans TaxID=7291 RepID=A0A6P8Z590_DROAB|nr:GRB10-interacting GYF protein 2 [Drosophila albomicans]
MAEHSTSYEQECQRAELLGIQPPDQAEFERLRSERIEQQLAEQEAAEANALEQQEEQLRGAGGKLDELNSILSSTQQRLNRFKQTACGSLSNIFARGGSFSGASGTAGSMDIPGSSQEEEQQQQQQPPVQRQPQPMAPPTAAQVSAAKAAQQKRMDGQLDKLDALINKADNAQLAMSEQTKQMRRMAK